jgi:Domain of unknown function (DU1801)
VTYPREVADELTPDEYIGGLEESRRADIGRIHERIRRLAPGVRSYVDRGMLAYGRYEYRYASGREGDWFVLGLASNKQYISLYAPTLSLESFVARLPKANLGRGCVRFKRVGDVDLSVIDEIVAASAANDGRRLVS